MLIILKFIPLTIKNSVGICQILSSEGETDIITKVITINLLASLYYQRKDKIGELIFYLS